MVISFLFLSTICLSSSFVYFKNAPDYLTRGTAVVFVPFLRFLLYSLVSSSFPVLLRNFLKKFSFISICIMVSASNTHKYL